MFVISGLALVLHILFTCDFVVIRLFVVLISLYCADVLLINYSCHSSCPPGVVGVQLSVIEQYLFLYLSVGLFMP